jgi:hypothetical protein
MLRFERIFWVILCLILLFLLLRQSADLSTSASNLATCPTIPACPAIQICPPCIQEALPKVEPGQIKPKPKEQPKEQPKAKLPDPPKLTPVERQQLLAWVKQNIHTLSNCRDAGQPVYRMTVSLNLNQKGDEIKSCAVGGEKVSATAIECIREKILKWKLPKSFGENPPQLVFGLQLD